MKFETKLKQFFPCFFLFIVLMFFPKGLFAQTLIQTVKGRVFDKESKVGLQGANVFVVGSNPIIGTITDNNGYFRLLVPVGRYSIGVSYIGYEDALISDILIVSGKQTDLQIQLREKFFTADEVKVVAKRRKDLALNNMAAISARVLSPDDAVRYAGGFSDPSRMASSFAGVAAVEGDGVNDIVIRGNSPRGLLWRLEGIEIPNPNHFSDGQGATGGSVGIITSNMLAMSDFLSGAFPAEYGNAYSGVMDISLRSGNFDKHEYGLQFGVVGLEASAEGPLLKNNNSSFLVNYRYSTFGFLGQMGLVNLGDNNIPPVFQDLSLNLKLPAKKAGIFYLFGIGGMSNTGTDPALNDTIWDNRFYETEYHKMGVFGLKHTITLPNQKTFLKTVIALEGQEDKWNRGHVLQNSERLEEYDDKYSYPFFRMVFQVNHKLNTKTLLRTGFNYSFISYDMFASEFNSGLTNYDTIITKKGNTSQSQVYAQINRRVTSNIEAGVGLHAMYFELNDRYSVEPRASLKWFLNTDQSVSFGFGLHTRAESIVAYLAPVADSNGLKYEANRNLNFTRAFHYVIGYDYMISNNFRLKTELYYQDLKLVPLDSRPGSNMSALNASYGVPEIPLVNKGNGYNYGLELTLEKFYSSNYYFLTTFSLFDSKYQTFDGEWFNTYFNSNYIANFLGGKDFLMGNTRQNILGLNLKLVYRGGFRYTPID
jgi:hypothetical protein